MPGGLSALDQAANYDGINYAPPIATDPATVQAALVAQLQSLQASGSVLAQVEIAAFPDRPQNYRMTHRVGAVLLMYRGAQYRDQEDNIRYIVQRRLYEFEVTILVRDLGWAYGGPASGTSPGAYQLIEAIRAGLTGFRVPGCDKAYPRGEGYEDHDDDGVWIYSVRFAVPAYAVENFVAPATPNLVTPEAKVGVNDSPIDMVTAVSSDQQSGPIT